MVGIAPHSEQDAKRKRPTLTAFEKQKATHLSRQLHLRLQYAKLKVEHGWQRQNLNEVENLYFRHLRKPRLESAEQIDMAMADSSRPLTPSEPGPEAPPPMAATQLQADEDASLQSHPPTITNSPMQPSTLPIFTSPSHQLSRRPTTIIQPTHSNNTNNSSNSSLTYDSFWSSHSSTTQSYRSAIVNPSPNQPPPALPPPLQPYHYSGAGPFELSDQASYTAIVAPARR